GCGRPAQQQTDDQKGHRETALPENVALTDEQRGDEEEALIAAAHRHRTGSDPADCSRMRRILCGGRRVHSGPTHLRSRTSTCIGRSVRDLDQPAVAVAAVSFQRRASTSPACCHIRLLSTQKNVRGLDAAVVLVYMVLRPAATTACLAVFPRTAPF